MPIDFSLLLAERRNLPIEPSIQTADGPKQNTPILSCENRPYDEIRQAFLRRKGGDREVTKTIQSSDGSYPHGAFTIFKERVRPFARQAIRQRKHVCSSPMYMQKATIFCSDP